MRLEPGTTVIENGTVIPGTGAAPVAGGCVIVTDGIIAYAGPAAGAPRLPPDVRRIDARGGTIMPGLVEAHFHATYFNIQAIEDLDIKYPVEYVSLLASVNCRLAVECGYTAARSGGCLFNVDVWLKKAIESNDVAEMKRTMEALNAAQHKVAEAMYRSAQASGAGPSASSAPGGEGATGNARPSGDVIDAEVVEEEKK